MGKKQITEAERQERRARAIRNRTNRALAELGIDLESVPADDREALAQAERNVKRLREIGERMRRRGSPTDPTAERVRNSAVDVRSIEISPAEAKAHQFDWIVDIVRDRLSERQYKAAERLRDCYLAMQPRSAVVDPTGAGGSSDPTGRLAITEAQEIAARAFAWVTARLEPIFLGVIENFVLEKHPDGAERCLTLAEYGTKLTRMAGENQGRAAGVMALKMACARLRALWWAYDAEQRERCHRTDRMMRSDIGRRAARDGWIVALWDWCHANGKLPATQGEVDRVRAAHNDMAMRLRLASPVELERHYRRRDRLISVAFRAFEDNRTARVA